MIDNPCFGQWRQRWWWFVCVGVDDGVGDSCHAHILIHQGWQANRQDSGS